MKVDVFKKIIKESVKEVIQEELKDILFEALKSNMGGKSNQPSPYDPPYTITNNSSTNKLPINTNVNLREKYNQTLNETVFVNLREKYNQALNETVLNFTSQDVPKFQPTPSADPINGQLPGGDVDLNQIMGLLNN